MTLRASTFLKNTMLDSVADALDKGIIYVYSGTQPASGADAAATGTLLGKIAINGGAFVFGEQTNGLSFDGPVGGVLSKPPADVWMFYGIADGTAGWFRFMGNDTDDLLEDTDFTLPRIDGRIALSGAEMTLAGSLEVVTGAPSYVSTFSLRFPVTF